MNELNGLSPPAIVRQAEDVAALMAQAVAEHEAGQRAERASLEHYRKAGERLARAKAAAGHGNWLSLLKGAKIPQQRASEYMRLAAGWGKLPPGGSFALKEALRAIEGEGERVEVAPGPATAAGHFEKANAAHVAAVLEAQRFLASASKTGALLREQRDELGEAEFFRWLGEGTGVSPEDALAYMRVPSRAFTLADAERHVERCAERALAMLGGESKA